MPGKSTLALVVAAVIAVVTVSAAAVVLADRAPTSVKKITGTSAETPGLAWSFDPAEYLDRPFAGLTDPRLGSSFNAGEPGFILTGDTFLTIAGSPTEGLALDKPVMISVDAKDGTARWQAPAHDLLGCSDTPLGGKIYCFAMSEIVTYDIDSGVSERRTIPESVYGLTTTSDALYIVEGSLEESVEGSDVRVHSGTFDDISANWSQPVDIGGYYEDLYGIDVLAVTDGVGLVRIGNQMAQFDAESGTPLWTTGDGVCVSQASLEPGGVVAQINSDCESYDSVSGELLRGPDGKVLTTTDSATAQRPMLEHRDDADEPILLGDSAYDRSSGELLWTNPSIVSGSQGAVTAIVGDTIYLRDTNTQSETGIDLRTGKQLWHNDTTQTFDVAGGGGRTLLGNDGTALTEFDLRTGSVVWTAPFVSIDSDPETFATGRAAQRYRDGWIYSSDRRMIGLAPL